MILDEKPLIVEKDRADILQLLNEFLGLSEKYIPVCKIGEGTFSRVYKALDLCFYEKSNYGWLEFSQQDEEDWMRMVQQVEKFQEKQLQKRPAGKDIEDYLLEYLEKDKRRPHFVALKCITPTSLATRVLDEMKFLKETGGRKNVIPPIEGLRFEEKIIAVMPFVKHNDFRSYFKELAINDIALYMKLLFTSLANIHGHGIIHRDIKPGNFLFSCEKHFGVLVDFGLAQVARASPREVKPGVSVQGGRSSLVSEQKKPAMRAPRAGTRGFRAPEVLFKHLEQTTAIDVWSVGIILLIFLTGRYPFFNSFDDMDALVELAWLFGTDNIKQAATLYRRRWLLEAPGVPSGHVTWPDLCQKLNPSLFPQIPSECYDFLEQCLCLDMNRRITAEKALSHPFILKFS